MIVSLRISVARRLASMRRTVRKEERIRLTDFSSMRLIVRGGNVVVRRLDSVKQPIGKDEKIRLADLSSMRFIIRGGKMAVRLMG